MTAVVLAAGSSTRMGRTKQTLSLTGKPLVVHVVERAQSAGIDDVRVVVGADAAEVSESLAQLEVELVPNPDHEQGSYSSLLAGLAGVDGPAVLLVADMPGVSPGVIRQVTEELEAGAWGVMVEYEDGPGHPFGISADLIASLPSEAEHRYLFRLLSDDERTKRTAWPDPRPADINTPEEYRRARDEANS